MRIPFLLCALCPALALQPWQNTSLPIPTRVANLLTLLTLEEKVANLYANGAPGAPRIGLPSYRYDEECMRGAVTSGVAPRPLGTGFPTLAALGSTFNTSLLEQVARVGAMEVRAYYNLDRASRNLPTTANCYAPVVNLVRDQRWGRNAEMTGGEDPTLARVYARHWVAAMRGGSNGQPLVTSVTKHLATYGGPEGPVGGNRMSFNANLSERTWREWFLPAFRGAAEGLTNSFMCSYTSVTLSDNTSRADKTPDCASSYLLNTIVRGEWGFEGWVTSDANAVANIYGTQGYVKTPAQAAIAALTGGCDMELTCCGQHPVYPTLVASVRSGLVGEEAVHAALARVLTGRFLAGDLDPPEASPWAHLNASDIYSPPSLQLAREAAQQALVLLANSPPASGGLPWPTLPTLPTGTTGTTARAPPELLCLVGPLANATQDFMGGYAPLPRPGDIVSPFAAFSRALGPAHVALVPGCVDGVQCSALAPSTAGDLGGCSRYIVVLGTSAYFSRGGGGRPQGASLGYEREGLDRSGVGVAGQQEELVQLVRSIAASSSSGGGGGGGSKPVVVVGVAGAMLDLAFLLLPSPPAALLYSAPGGQWAGQALADVVLGRAPAVGRLTTTWFTPSAFAALGGIEDYSMVGRTYKDAAEEAVVFPFGWGLGYSAPFVYNSSSLALNGSSFSPCDTISFTLTLQNAGQWQDADVPQLYLSIPGASVQLPGKSLVAFQKTPLVQPGGEVAVTLVLPPEANAVMREGDFQQVIEPGERTFWLGASSSSQRSPGVAGSFRITGATTPLASC